MSGEQGRGAEGIPVRGKDREASKASHYQAAGWGDQAKSLMSRRQEGNTEELDSPQSNVRKVGFNWYTLSLWCNHVFK